MKKPLILLLCVLLALGAGSSALADLKRGDVGDDVKHLQRLLIDGEWLVGFADGQYGRRTEAAVRAYQAALGLEETGEADDALIALLESGAKTPEDMRAAMEAAAKAEEEAVPDCCGSAFDDEGCHTVYCSVHLVMLERCDDLEAIGTADTLTIASQLWTDEIDRLYGVWMERSEGAQRLAVMSAKAAWIVEAQAQRAALEALYSGDEAGLERQWLQYARDHAVRLCAASAQ